MNQSESGQPGFAEPWQAEAYAMAQVLIETGRIAAAKWPVVFGAALKEAADRGDPDDSQTYYVALAEALGRALVAEGRLEASEIEIRIEDWRAAYMRTPHGKPVTLTAG
jgi:nitrile hydratase accessory protein